SPGSTGTRSSSASCLRTACLEHERLVLVELGLLGEVPLEPGELRMAALSDAPFLDVDEAGLVQRVAQRLRVVDEAVSPRVGRVVHDDARQLGAALGRERAHGPADV